VELEGQKGYQGIQEQYIVTTCRSPKTQKKKSVVIFKHSNSYSGINK